MSTTLFSLVTGPLPALPTYAQWLAAWLYRMGSGFALGYDLARTGPPMANTPDADHLLEGAEAAGWIKSTGPAPDLNQLRLGVPSVRRELWLNEPWTPRSWHGFEPGPKWLEAWAFALKWKDSSPAPQETWWSGRSR